MFRNPFFLRRSAFYPAAFAVCWLAAGSLQANHPEVKVRTVDASERERIDQAAIKLPNHKRTPDLQTFYSDITGWIVARSPMPRDEEEQRTESAHLLLLQKYAPTETPARVFDVLESLNAALPLRMQPLIHEYNVSVVRTTDFLSETTGAPWVHLSDEFVHQCLQDDAGRDRLAFAIAHELGHICREHCRRRHQLLWFQQLMNSGRRLHLSSEKLKRATDRLIQTTNDRLEFLITLEEDYEADLFAVHLCRNAGFDIENGLDVVRQAALNEPDDEQKTRALRRLSVIRSELDGRIVGADYGLISFEPSERNRERVPDRGLIGQTDIILCVHGMESDLDKFESMVPALDSAMNTSGRRILGFQYPGDASLSRVARFLHNELKRTGADTTSWDFITHSAGGLVVRCNLELNQLPFRRAVFIGTPHLGSDLTSLRPLLEAKQFFGDLRLGFSNAVEKTIADGRGQVTYDLQPDSLFLSHLNRPMNPRDVTRYHVVNGRALSPMKGVLLKTSFAAIRVAIQTHVTRSSRAPLSLRKGMQEWVRKLDIPDEIARGDLAVSLNRSTLEDVASETTFEHSHSKLPDKYDVIDHVVDILQ